jgi:hypothetical protein
MAKHQASSVVDALFGAFFLILAVVVLFVAWETTPLGAGVVAVVLGFLGAEALASFARGRASLLSRLGPLP